MPTTFSVALTGGIGSGKSTISTLFTKLGVPVIDTDLISREITQPGKTALKKIISIFGHRIETKAGFLDRKELRDIVFNDPQKKYKLESILHPLIYNEVNKRLSEIIFPYCIVVVPLLIETNVISQFDRVLLITAPEKLQIKRTMKRDRCSIEQVKIIIDSQVSNDERIKYADDIIDNTIKITELVNKVKILHQQYLKLGQTKQQVMDINLAK